MAIRGERITELVLSAESKQVELAEKMIRKYWGHETFHSLNDDDAVLSFAKKHAQTVDKLERIANYFDDEYAQGCFHSLKIDSAISLYQNRFDVFEKTSVLTKDSLVTILNTLDEKTAGLVSCLPSKTLAKYLLIAHNEGTEKAEEIRGNCDLKDYESEYLRVYDFSNVEKTQQKSFSEEMHGTTRAL